MTLSNADNLPDWPGSAKHVPVEELARRQGVESLGSADDLVVLGLMDDEEHAAFLASPSSSARPTNCPWPPSTPKTSRTPPHSTALAWST